MLNVTNCTFSNNIAVSQGGAINYSYRRPVLSVNTYENNTAVYGPDIASYPFKITFEDTNSTQMHLENIGSGIGLDTPLKLIVKDYDNQTMLLASKTQILITALNSSEASVLGTNSAVINEGIVIFDKLIPVADQGLTNIKFKVATNAIDSTTISTLFGEEYSQSIISMDFRY